MGDLGLSALDLAARIRRRELSSEEAVRTALRSIEALDPELSAFTQVMERRALWEARARDRSPSDAPFHGVPIGIKDLNLVRGTFTRFGSRAYRWLLSPVDDRVARAVKRAGFVIVGKLATSEFGTVPVTEPEIHAPTRNPWDRTRTSGGSSGGSGSAVAAGILPLAHGSDGGGSIRIPAAFCHLYGFKASRGLVPLAGGERVDRLGLAVEGGLCHTVDDAAAFVEVLAGKTLPACPRPARLKIRFTTESVLSPTLPAFAEATVRVARLLQEMGHEVEPGERLDGTLEDFLPLWTRLSADLPIWREAMAQPVTRWLRELGRPHTYEAVQQRHQELQARVAAWWGEADLWLTPTIGRPPPEVGAFRGLSAPEAFQAMAPLGQFTALFNVSGQPAASIPAGLTEEGWPIGVQLVGRLGHDALVLDLSRELERAMPWTSRRPRV
jgi:amidase